MDKSLKYMPVFKVNFNFYVFVKYEGVAKLVLPIYYYYKIFLNDLFTTRLFMNAERSNKISLRFYTDNFTCYSKNRFTLTN